MLRQMMRLRRSMSGRGWLALLRAMTQMTHMTQLDGGWWWMAVGQPAKPSSSRDTKKPATTHAMSGDNAASNTTAVPATHSTEPGRSGGVLGSRTRDQMNPDAKTGPKYAAAPINNPPNEHTTTTVGPCPVAALDPARRPAIGAAMMPSSKTFIWRTNGPTFNGRHIADRLSAYHNARRRAGPAAGYVPPLRPRTGSTWLSTSAFYSSMLQWLHILGQNNGESFTDVKWYTVGDADRRQ